MKLLLKIYLVCISALFLEACAPLPSEYSAGVNLTKLDRTQSQQSETISEEEPPESSIRERLDKARFVPSSSGSRYALLIGINDYDFLPDLQTAIQDAQALGDELETGYGFEITSLVNPTRGEVIRKLSAYRSKLSSEDKLLIYYAGHGWLDEDAEEGYWLTRDAEEDNPANWLSNSTISSYLKSIQAKHLMVIADSCYSGTLTRGINLVQQTPDYYAKMDSRKSRTVLTSGGLEPVSDIGGGGHSVFAAALLSALRENGDVMDGTELFTRVRNPVSFNSDQVPQHGIIHKAGHDGGDFLFAKLSN